MALTLWQRFKSLVTPGQPLGYSQVYTGTVSDTGLHISPQMAMTCTTVNACVQAIATEIAKLPWSVISEEGTGRTVADDHPLHHLLRREANPDMSALSWKELMCMSAALTGNGYSLIERGADGRPRALWYLRPDLMSVIRLGNGQIAYIYSGSEGDQVFTPFDIFHLAWLSPDGVLGYSPISLARQAIGLAIAQETFGASYFRNASRPGGALVSDRELTDEALQRIRESWESRMRGMHAAGSVAILEGGLKWQPMSLSPEDSQWLQSREFQREEICAIFRVPPSVIGIGAKTSYASAEQANREWVGQCLSSWAARLEAEAQRKLLRRDEPFTTEISFDTLQKPDLMTRYQTFSIARQFGFLSVNEIRSQLGMAAIGEQGDEYLKPTNMVPASNAYGGAKVSPPEAEPEAQGDAPTARWLWQALTERDCGTGAGGFQPGNTCAKGEGDGTSRPDARALIDFILDPSHNDGFTVDPYVKDQPTEGIMVAVPGHELKLTKEQLSGPDAEKAIDDWIDGAWDEISASDDIYIGGWYNTSEGVFYLDLSRRFSREGEPNVQDEHPRAQDALEAARDASQLAVFNLESLKTTWVMYSKNDPRKPEGWDQKYKEWFDGLSPSDKSDASGMGFDAVRNTGEKHERRQQEQAEQQAIHASATAVEGRTEEDSARTDEQGASGRQSRSGYRDGWQYLFELTQRNCGTGAGGFQAGNSCATGGDANSEASNWLKTHRHLLTGRDSEFRDALAKELNVAELDFFDDSSIDIDETDDTDPVMKYIVSYKTHEGEDVEVEVHMEGSRERVGDGSSGIDDAYEAAENAASDLSGSDLEAKIEELSANGNIPSSTIDRLRENAMDEAAGRVDQSKFTDEEGVLDEDAYQSALDDAYMKVIAETSFSDLGRSLRESITRAIYNQMLDSGDFQTSDTYENSTNWSLGFKVNDRYSVPTKLEQALSDPSSLAKGQGTRVLTIVQASLYRMIAKQWDSRMPPQTIEFSTPGDARYDPQNRGRMRLYNGMLRRFAKDFGARILTSPTAKTIEEGGMGSWTVELSRKNMRARAKKATDTIVIRFVYRGNEKRNCGTGAGGFQPGNECAKGGGESDAGVKITEQEIGESENSIYKLRAIADQYKSEECAGRAADDCDDLQKTVNITSERVFTCYTGDGYKGITASASGREWDGSGESDIREAAEESGLTQSRESIAEHLAEGRDPEEDGFEDEVDAQYEEQYADMNRIAEQVHAELNRDAQRSKLDEPPPITLFRGMSLDSDTAGQLLDDLKSGQFTSVTVQSWSKSIDIAKNFAKGECPVILVGRNFSTGVDINAQGLTRVDEEREVLVPSTRYRVSAVRVLRTPNGDVRGAIVEVDAGKEQK